MSPSSPRAAIDFSLNNLGNSKNSIEALLIDIPSFSIGLLGFAVLTFFLILKKIKLSSFLLLASVLIGFFSGIIDLTRVCFVHENLTRSRTSSHGLIHFLIALREVLTAVATGLRFLFFWAYVSQPPLCEQGSASFLSVHSGNWLHWGLTGSLLRWSTLLASLMILILQSIWRTTGSHHKFGPVYDVDGAFEITASAIYMVKLLLNAMIVEPQCRRETLWQYSTAMFALFINMGIGVGNLIEFKFADTILGRLLLVIELYILIVVIMVFSFYTKDPAADTSRQPHSKRDSSFRGLRVSFYDAPQGYYTGSNVNPTGPTPSHSPSAQRGSSWPEQDAPQKPSDQSEPTEDGEQRRPEGEAEPGVAISTSEELDPSTPKAIPSDPGQSTRRQGPVSSSLHVVSPVTYPLEREISEESSSLSLGAPYDISQPSSTPATAALVTSPDSPTLGPGGIRTARGGDNPSAAVQSPSDASSTTSQTTIFEGLLREQNELERSIAALQTMFTPPGRGAEERGASSDTTSDFREQSRTRESSGTRNGRTSASNKSDFSLSNFPEPPRMPQVTRDVSTSGHQSSLLSVLIPSTRMSLDIGEQTFPTSTEESGVAEFRRPESAGTRYDVTSFIGDLTSPNRSASQNAMYLKASESGSEAGSVTSATIMTTERNPSTAVLSRPQLIGKKSLVRNETFSTGSSGSTTPTITQALLRNRSAAPDSTGRLRVPPLPTRAFSQAPSARLLAAQGGRVGLPPRPKLDVTPPSDKRTEDVPPLPRTSVFKKP